MTFQMEASPINLGEGTKEYANTFQNLISVFLFDFQVRVLM